MTSIALERGDVVVGVDTHKDQYVAVALDGRRWCPLEGWPDYAHTAWRWKAFDLPTAFPIGTANHGYSGSLAATRLRQCSR